MDPLLHCFGALALELSPDQDNANSVLERPEAERLAGFLARDLARLLPGVEKLDGAFAAALFDPAELLRPGWPVHAELVAIAEVAPGTRGGRVIAVGAHEGQMPSAALQPDRNLEGGLLRLLPFALLGPAEQVAEVGRQMEEQLLESGMAEAHTALAAQDGFGIALEHARFLSLHDLCALTAAQYQHAGLDAVWRMIEAALLAPDAEEWYADEHGVRALLIGGQARIADFSASAFHHHVGGGTPDPDGYTRYRRAQRQLLAILGAHGIAVEQVPVSASEDPAVLLRPTRQ